MATELVVSAGGVERTVAVPDGGGSAVNLSFPAVTGDELTVRISKVRQETTVDRRFGEVTELPVGVATIAIDGLAPLRAAPALDPGCRDDLLRLDGTPLPVRVSGSTDDLLSGKAATIVPCSTAPLELAKGTHHLTAAPGLRTGIDLDQLVLRSSALAQPTAASPSTGTGADGHPRWQLAHGPHHPRLAVLDRVLGGVGRGTERRLDRHRRRRLARRSDAGRRRDERVVAPTGRPRTGRAPALEAAAHELARSHHLGPRRPGLHRADRSVPLRVGVGASRALEGPTFVEPWRPTSRFGWPTIVGLTAASALVSALIIKPIWALPTALVVFTLAWLRRYGLVAVVGWLGIAAVALLYLKRQNTLKGLPGFGWVVNVEDAHRPTLFALVLITAGLLVDRRVRRRSQRVTPTLVLWCTAAARHARTGSRAGPRTTL